MVRWASLVLCTLLSACATPPTAPPRADPLFNDAVLRASPARADADVFALSDWVLRNVMIPGQREINQK